jgi:VWFA-related protein
VARFLLIAVGLLLMAQQSTPQQPPRFRGGTNYVQVDVFATRDGAPVQDLSATDFEVFEDNAPQKIDTFEHIVVAPPGPQAERVEPTSVTAANQLAADPHRRVFVVFLDKEHVPVEGSHAIVEPLIQFMTEVMGPDDLVGIMTPDMSPSQLTFGRKTEVIEEGLRKNWIWGRRDTIVLDEKEQQYAQCFPPLQAAEGNPSALARELIARRRERMVLETLHDTISHMAGIREGRTAVVAVTSGWRLYRPNEAITRLRTDDTGRYQEPIPGTPPPVGVGPGGTLTHRPNQGQQQDERYECDRDRMDLAMIDDETYFRDLFGEANRANVSFYPIDPRGLVAFDSPIGPEPPPTPAADHAILRARHESLRTLAANTDGLALLDSNDLKAQMRRLAADLTSYYLIGYYSSNAKLDGRFRSINVRAKRSGIDVRARKGYRAPTAAEVASASASAAAAAAMPADTVAITDSLNVLERDTRIDESRWTMTSRPPELGAPAMFRRGPLTGNQFKPAPSRRFSRTDRLRLEAAATEDVTAWNGALLDRTGKRLGVPVTTGVRTDASSGQTWLTADLVLAPLGAGDYIVELTFTRGGAQQRVLSAFRVAR